MTLTPPIFPKDGSEAVLVVVPSAVEINFAVESLLEHLHRGGRIGLQMSPWELLITVWENIHNCKIRQTIYYNKTYYL